MWSDPNKQHRLNCPSVDLPFDPRSVSQATAPVFLSAGMRASVAVHRVLTGLLAELLTYSFRRAWRRSQSQLFRSYSQLSACTMKLSCVSHFTCANFSSAARRVEPFFFSACEIVGKATISILDFRVESDCPWQRVTDSHRLASRCHSQAICSQVHILLEDMERSADKIRGSARQTVGHRKWQEFL